MSSDLISQKCEACTIDAPKVTEEESLELIKTLDNWVILNEGFDYLEKIFTFDNYEKSKRKRDGIPSYRVFRNAPYGGIKTYCKN